MHIQAHERRHIERALTQHKSLRAIARRLGRSVSSISNEVANNSVRGVYTAHAAERKAVQRRKQAKNQCLKVALDSRLKEYIVAHITDDQAPHALSVRLKNIDTHLPYASTKSIYTFIHSVHGRPLEHHLYTKRVKRRRGRSRRSVSAHDMTKVSIEDRPRSVEKRRVFGHFEGDFIESGKDGTGSVLVLVERKTRYPFLIYTEDRTTLTVNTLIATVLKDIPVLSITLDNDVSFQKHEALSELIDATVYFTRPYTSSDKGTVENRNGRLREYIPKRSDISQYQDRVPYAEHMLRTRFLVVLNGRSPQEAWNEEMRSVRMSGMIQKTAPAVR